MSVYRCADCEEYKDADYHDCYARPGDGEYICGSCEENYYDEDGELTQKKNEA